ncbi:MAG: hypothetical protein IJ489_11770 [Clostridia bacterium]|nr:hypothetical protein [Clostridia bacterium]
MKIKRILAALLCAAMILALCACNKAPDASDTSDSSTENTETTQGTSETTSSESETTRNVFDGVLETQEVKIEDLVLPLEEIANAIKIESEPVTETKEIPLIIILANFDADGDGEDDWDENEPDKLYKDQSQPYYGEQWAGSEVTDHYDRYFGEGLSLTNYYEELTMGAFKFVPIEFDVVPEGSPYTNGIIEVVVHHQHPSSGSGGSAKAQSAIKAVFEATDPYIDYTKYDINGNGRIDSTEMGVVILNPGQDASNGTTNNPRQKFQVHGTSQGLPAFCDGLSFSKVSNFGEYGAAGGIMNIGTPAHELAHNLGAEDLYDTKRNGHGGSYVSNWPRAYDFSLECNGNHRGNGAYPTYLDPYHRVYLGWAEEVVVEDGVYTISSTLTDKYTVLRVNTPDPGEYYLIEIRLKEGFEKLLTSGDSLGGIMIWHIDEDLNKRFFTEGSASTSATLNGERHDPAIVPLFRVGYDTAGQYIMTTSPSDPFYYYSEDDPSTAIFDSGKFHSVTNGTQSLNSYPDTWEGKENYNLRVEVLSEPGQEMTVKITSGRKDFAPVLSATYSTKTHNSITVQGRIEALNNANVTGCAIMLATDENFTENVVAKNATLNENGMFEVTFDGLTPETHYYYKAYLDSDNGYAEATSSTPTSSAPKEKTYVEVSLYSDADARAYTIKANFGGKLEIPSGWLGSITRKKPGMKLEGWYYDAEFTKPYDMNTVIEKGTEPFSLYAKWVEQ